MDVNRTQTNYHSFLANNDPRAWEEFYLVYFNMMVWWAMQWGCSEAEARDLAQEKTVQLFTREQFAKFQSRGPYSFRRWLKRVITNEAKSYLRRERRKVAPVDDDDLAQDGFDKLIDRELVSDTELWDSEDRGFYLKCAISRAFRKTIQMRSAKEYSVFVRRVIEGKTSEQTSRELGLERAVLDVYLGRFRRCLGQELHKLFVDEKNYIGPLAESIGEQELLDVLQAVYTENQGMLDTIVEERTPADDPFQDTLCSLLRLISEAPPPDAGGDWLLVLDDRGRRWVTVTEGMHIGRAKDNELQISGAGVSSLHATLFRQGSGWRVRDEKSTNHVYINGRQAGEEAVIYPGDWLQLSEACLVYVGIPANLMQVSS